MPKHARPKPRAVRLGVLVATAAVTTTALSLASAATDDDSASEVTQLGLEPAYLAEGRSATARLEVAAGKGRCVTASRLTVAVRDGSGRNLDFPGAASDVRICPSGYTFTSGARSFAAGTYTMFGSWRDTGGTWHPLPSTTLTVAAGGAPRPAPAPTAEPTATRGPAPTATTSSGPTPTAPSEPAPTSTQEGADGPSWDPSGGWRTVFADEFEGTALDTAKWTAGWFGSGVTGPVNSAESACYDARNVSVSDGALHLRLTGEPSSCQGRSQPYTGAHVNTMDTFSFSYGAVEYRAKVPVKDGEVANWPALWDNGRDWPEDGETDTMEGLSGSVCSYWHSSGTDRGHCPKDGLTGWHTFGHQWEPGRITWFYDGRPVHTQTSGVVGSPHYLIMQNTQGSYGGPTLAPADLQIDYVRVWSR
ncbi:glycoside hydrolase family 16 protein [Streptomyces glaucus]|uniref:GH16 domain-containing protein n=1 Tax=Streptomyces glaucus TaxID=284029 RepID=A0ABN3J7W5_9ACTN